MIGGAIVARIGGWRSLSLVTMLLALCLGVAAALHGLIWGRGFAVALTAVTMLAGYIYYVPYRALCLQSSRGDHAVTQAAWLSSCDMVVSILAMSVAGTLAARLGLVPFLVLCTLAASGAAPALAQELVELDEIVVTGSKRGEKLRGVGPLLMPLSPDDSSVLTFVDGAPLMLEQSASSYLDLEQVEVLKGPQNTLFGRSTSGGAINLVPALPTDVFEGALRSEFGSDGLYRAETVLNLPILPGRLATRFALRQSGGMGMRRMRPVPSRAATRRWRAGPRCCTRPAMRRGFWSRWRGKTPTPPRFTTPPRSARPIRCPRGKALPVTIRSRVN